MASKTPQEGATEESGESKRPQKATHKKGKHPKLRKGATSDIEHWNEGTDKETKRSAKKRFSRLQESKPDKKQNPKHSSNSESGKKSKKRAKRYGMAIGVRQRTKLYFAKRVYLDLKHGKKTCVYRLAGAVLDNYVREKLGDQK